MHDEALAKRNRPGGNRDGIKGKNEKILHKYYTIKMMRGQGVIKMSYRNDSFAAVRELERQRLGRDEEPIRQESRWDEVDDAFDGWRDEQIDRH